MGDRLLDRSIYSFAILWIDWSSSLRIESVRNCLLVRIDWLSGLGSYFPWVLFPVSGLKAASIQDRLAEERLVDGSLGIPVLGSYLSGGDKVPHLVGVDRLVRVRIKLSWVGLA